MRTPEEIIRRVADQSFLLCFDEDGQKISRKDVGDALDELLGLKEPTPDFNDAEREDH
jgi:hypothetical protein